MHMDVARRYFPEFPNTKLCDSTSTATDTPIQMLVVILFSYTWEGGEKESRGRVLDGAN